MQYEQLITILNTTNNQSLEMFHMIIGNYKTHFLIMRV